MGYKGVKECRTHEVNVRRIDHAVHRQHADIRREVRAFHVHGRVSAAGKLFRHVVSYLIRRAVLKHRGGGVECITEGPVAFLTRWLAYVHASESRMVLRITAHRLTVRYGQAEIRLQAKPAHHRAGAKTLASDGDHARPVRMPMGREHILRRS